MNFISKKYYETLLNYKQKRISKLYKSEGLTDRVLNEQVKINKKKTWVEYPWLLWDAV